MTETYKEQWIGQIEASDAEPKKMIFRQNGPDGKMEGEEVEITKLYSSNDEDLDNEIPY